MREETKKREREGKDPTWGREEGGRHPIHRYAFLLNKVTMDQGWTWAETSPEQQ